MQLGELQSQIERFQRREVTVIALSVDAPGDSLAMIERLGLSFALLSDPDQEVVQAFKVQNPKTKQLALHAVYIVDTDGKVFYRKVASRRPTSEELIDAIDAHRGVYPSTIDEAKPRTRSAVAYPKNNFQGLMELAAAEQLPGSVNRAELDAVVALMKRGESDDALIAFKSLVASSKNATREALQKTAAYTARRVFFDKGDEAITLGSDLRQRLQRVSEIEQQRDAAADEQKRDEMIQLLARARAGLALTQAKIRSGAEQWNLRRAMATVRSLREVANAATR